MERRSGVVKVNCAEESGNNLIVERLNKAINCESKKQHFEDENLFGSACEGKGLS